MNDYSKYSDNQLLTLVLEEGIIKEHALVTLWNRYSKKLYRYCMYKSFNSSEVDEIHQLTWIKFYNYVMSGKQIQSIEAFLYKTAYLISIEKYRKQNADKIINFISSDMEQYEDSDNLIVNIENTNLMDQISVAVNYLDDEFKEVFLLKWFALLSYEEISKITCESIEVVKKRSYRAMEKVIKILKPIINEIS